MCLCSLTLPKMKLCIIIFCFVGALTVGTPLFLAISGESTNFIDLNVFCSFKKYSSPNRFLRHHQREPLFASAGPDASASFTQSLRANQQYRTIKIWAILLYIIVTRKPSIHSKVNVLPESTRARVHAQKHNTQVMNEKYHNY